MERLHRTVSESGLVTEYLADERDGKLVTRTFADLSFNHEYAKTLGNDPEYWRQGVQKNMAHAAHIPEWLVVHLRNHGVNVFTAPAKDIVAKMRELGFDHFVFANV